ncbi:SCO family protein [Aliiroseovarius sp. PTFE2010]|uniref:SCO family protein n=1 Tax=Aliiroseovarius sp. PTFE2010 TaxID=3417190 RepID=UPI003CF62372
MTRTISIIAAALAALVVAGSAFFAFRPSDDIECGGGVVAGGDIGGPFELVREDGVTVTDQDVFTKPTILYFGYTFCPDVCPLDSARNTEALEILLENGYDVQAAFISIDPERDTPEVVGEFTDIFHDRMIGLTGTPEQVAVASKAYKTYYNAHDEEDPEYYLVDHSTFTYLVMPDTGFATFFKREATPEHIAETTACLIDQSK